MGKKLTQEQFIEKSNQIHNFEYNYSKSIYLNNRSKIIIICPIHGEFEQNAHNHMNGSKCPNCKNDYMGVLNRYTQEQFIEKANKIHNFTYDYSKTEYINSFTKTTIICQIHGEFEQAPNMHLSGQGCPICNSSRGENKIRFFLISNNIHFEEQKTFDECKNLYAKHKLRFDFYLPSHNICIEYDGIQHFKPVEWFGGKEAFLKQKNNDQIKNQYCLENGISLLRIPYIKYKNIENILKEKLNV